MGCGCRRSVGTRSRSKPRMHTNSHQWHKPKKLAELAQRFHETGTPPINEWIVTAEAGCAASQFFAGTHVLVTVNGRAALVPASAKVKIWN